MSYRNELIEPSKPPSHPLKLLGYKARRFVGRIRNCFLRTIVHFKLILRERGYDVFTSCNEMLAARLEKFPKREWKWDSEGSPNDQEIQRRIDDEILPWIHENVMRAPSPLGFGETGIMIWVVCGEEDVAQELPARYDHCETSEPPS